MKESIMRSLLSCALSGFIFLMASNLPSQSGSIPVKSKPSNAAAAQSKPIEVNIVDPKTSKQIWFGHCNNSVSDQKIATMWTIDGVFFQNSKPSIRTLAPKATYSFDTRIARVTGGVKLISLTEKNVILTCDVAEYDIAKNKILGRGHVVCSKEGSKIYGNSFLADPKLKQVIMPAPELMQKNEKIYTNIILK